VLSSADKNLQCDYFLSQTYLRTDDCLFFLSFRLDCTNKVDKDSPWHPDKTRARALQYREELRARALTGEFKAENLAQMRKDLGLPEEDDTQSPSERTFQPKKQQFDAASMREVGRW
jgi:hypothetical protein